MKLEVRRPFTELSKSRTYSIPFSLSPSYLPVFVFHPRETLFLHILHIFRIPRPPTFHYSYRCPPLISPAGPAHSSHPSHPRLRLVGAKSSPSAQELCGPRFSLAGCLSPSWGRHDSSLILQSDACPAHILLLQIPHTPATREGRVKKTSSVCVASLAF